MPFRRKSTADDLPEKLLALNLDLVAKEQHGKPAIGPWDTAQ